MLHIVKLVLIIRQSNIWNFAFYDCFTKTVEFERAFSDRNLHANNYLKIYFFLYFVSGNLREYILNFRSSQYRNYLFPGNALPNSTGGGWNAFA